MFFIAGVSSKRDKLDFDQKIVCSNCGRYGRYEVIMDYTCLSLFFIPILKWNKKYYVKSSCCGSLYLLDNSVGNEINRGENISLRDQDLELIKRGYVSSKKQCPNCNFEIADDFQYCPKCGKKFA